MKPPIYLRRVEGVSLMPAVRPGRLLVFIRFRRIRPGRLVLARADGREVIKQVAGRRGQYYQLEGLSPGTSSYLVPETAILGVAVGRAGPAAETG